MKKTIQTVVSLALAFGIGLNAQPGGNASAQADQVKIKDRLGEQTILFEDGSMWSYNDVWEAPFYTPGSVVSITGREKEGLGVTKSGELVRFEAESPPVQVAGQTGVKQAAGEFWLKNDGSVWNGKGKLNNLSGISIIANSSDAGGFGNEVGLLGALSRTGEIFIQNNLEDVTFESFGTVEDVARVTSLAVYPSRFGVQAAVLYDNGKVVVRAKEAFGDPLPVQTTVVAEDAAAIAFGAGDLTRPSLLVTRKDGTVWRTWDEPSVVDKQVEGLRDIVKVDNVTDSDTYDAQRADGSWVRYESGDIEPISAPSVSKVDVSLSGTKVSVSGLISVGIEETFTNGATRRVTPMATNVTVDKPYVLKLQPNGQLKALGVGQAKVTVTSSGVSKSFTVVSTLKKKLQHAKLVNGTVFVPVQSVFQALGGTVVAKNGAIEIKLGEKTISLKAGDKNAKIDGKAVVLKAAPIKDGTETLVPASLLSDVAGATTKWDAKWKQALITVGGATLTVDSNETAALAKKAAQGTLAKYIGKTYWVNHFQGWERLTKVTVTDIVPGQYDEFALVFKTSAGKTLKSEGISADQVAKTFSDEYELFAYDPQKKYAWSAAVWKQIKAEKVAIGMTKDQVRLSWGPAWETSVSKIAGSNVEVWLYGNYSVVSFINGKVVSVVSG